VEAPALPLSAFQSAKVFLDRLAAHDRKSARLALHRIEAKHVDATKDRGEHVRVTVDLDFVGSEVEECRAEATALAKALEEEKAVTAVDSVQEMPTAAASSARTARIGFDCDPSKMPSARASNLPADDRLPNSTSYIIKCACTERVEIGNVDLTSSSRRTPDKAWIEERWTIRSRPADRALPRPAITNFAIVLERDHPHASVTAFTLDPAPEECPTDARASYRMRLELTLLRPARADDVEQAPEKR